MPRLLNWRPANGALSRRSQSRRLLGSAINAPMLVAAILTGSCGPEPTPEQQAVRVAHQHARDRFRYPFDIERLPPQVVDRGDHWLIRFDLPPEYAGGAPEVFVRKGDLAVIGSWSFQ